MPRALSNGMELEYDTFGDPSRPTVLLIMGLGTQMTAWRPEFCRAVAERGFHVVRYDNRDCGLSTFLDDCPTPDIRAVLAGDTSTVPYLIADMARDAVGLLDALGVEAAHVVGASMGGMIAQQFAIDHPDRVLSLCSIMSTTGARSVGRATSEALAALTAPPPGSREEAVERAVRSAAVIGSPAYPTPDEELRERAAAAYDRSHRPEGFVRQYAAILASPDRTPHLRAVTVPTLVVHGADDPLIDRDGGEATAAAVPDAELVVLPGMGHDLPEPLWPTIVDAVARNAARAAGPVADASTPSGTGA
ncbi:alpha/beta fold hydrolase [Streptomyces megasporus]|uniref:alpha/beta fold hydrolase n=1 Tax=Streptomyces megasporus TaxID=44060 RepID=UPI0006923B98|nr:alpha/beta hydrolase [Streptomyces megasporus]